MLTRVYQTGECFVLKHAQNLHMLHAKDAQSKPLCPFCHHNPISWSRAPKADTMELQFLQFNGRFLAHLFLCVGDAETAELARARTELAAAAAPLLPAVQRSLCVAPPETAALPKTLDEAPQPALRLAPAGAQLGSAQGSAGPGNPSEKRDQALPLTAGLPGFGAPPRPALITAAGPAGLGPPPLLGSVLPAARAAGPPDSDAGGSAPGGKQGDSGAEGESGGAAAAAPLLLGGQAGGVQRGAQWGAWRASRVRILHVRLKSRTLALVVAYVRSCKFVGAVHHSFAWRFVRQVQPGW